MFIHFNVLNNLIDQYKNHLVLSTNSDLDNDMSYSAILKLFLSSTT